MRPGQRPLNPGAGAAPKPGLATIRPRRLNVTSLKPLTYSIMHLCVAVSVAFALTRDWRIALGVGVIEPMVQTVAYVVHERAWSASRPRTGGVMRKETGSEN